MNGNPWAARARGLDRYRWQLLRERHGLVGSAVRFVRDAIIETLYGLAARWCMASTITAQPCDFLLLQSSPRVVLLRRKQAFIEALKARGHGLVEIALPEMRHLLGARMLKRPPHAVPLRYFPYAAHAAWLVDKYSPRILLNDRNGSFYSPFLRLALNSEGNLLVQLAHSTTVEASRRLGMNDYDYYFLFGHSSLEALKARKLRFGTTIAVLAGSHMIDESYALPAPDPTFKTVLILGLGPDKEKMSGYQATYTLLRDWAERHPEYRMLVKAHPRSYMEFWNEAEQDLKNVQLLPRECTLAEALSMASIVVNIMSNAVIEAALAGRPLLFVSCGDARDILSQGGFLGGQITTMEQLEQGVYLMEQDYAASCKRSVAFAEYHLAHALNGLRQNVHDLERLLAGDLPTAQSEQIKTTI